MAGGAPPALSPHRLPLLPDMKIHRPGFETFMKSLQAFCKGFNSLTALLSPKKKNIFMTQGAIIGLTAAEWPQQLLEQLGTAQHGHRGAREASWKVKLGLIPPRAMAVRGPRGAPHPCWLHHVPLCHGLCVLTALLCPFSLRCSSLWENKL